MKAEQEIWPRLGGIDTQLGNHSLAEVLRSILETILQLPWLAMDAGGIFLNHPREKRLELLTQINFTPYIAGTCSQVRHGHCLCGRVAQTGRLLHVDCVDERHETQYEGMSNHGHYVVPIRWEDEVVGIMVLYVAVHHPCDEDEVKVLEDFADLIGLLIHTWRIRQDMALADRILIHSSHGILITDDRLRIQWVNRALEHISGYRLEELVGMTPGIFASGRHDSAFYKAMWHRIEAEGRWEGEIWNRNRAGDIHPHWLSVLSLKDQDGKTLQYAGLYVDLSEIKAAQERIHHLAYFDEVTGLPNLNWLKGLLPGQLESLGDGGHLFLLLLSATHFQEINGVLGHNVGDAVLREITRRLSEAVRSGKIVRTGTDEFAVVWHGSDAPESAILRQIHRLERCLAVPFQHAYQSLDLRCRMGAGWCRSGDLDVEILLKQASTALAACKRQTSDSGYLIYSEALGEKVRQRQHLAGLLIHAVERRELSLRFQPQVDVHGRLVGAEVLLRWENGEYGAVPPDLFIPLAEEGGQIIEIGTWVFEETLRHLHCWHERQVFAYDAFPRVAINLSPLQLMSPHVVRHFIETCRLCGEPADSIELEVTESSMEHYFDLMVRQVRQLAAGGFKIAIDDFGTGHSSLARLQQFPLHVLKIDRSFVTNMALADSHVTLIRSIVDMAHGLGLKVVVEGVETPEQYATLSALGCDYFQGYFFSPPLTETEFLHWAAERRRELEAVD
ncbi:MAG: hypothetical protein AXA67_03705 [Methylothermaceae bacteria B42]|nr:MAG: hypothetical protein AXA67_03705 [Methylothermaceae bacteria B42]HHJ38207.1 EAL domain-containing protein [Methylothermaceae bacterium]